MVTQHIGGQCLHVTEAFVHCTSVASSPGCPVEVFIHGCEIKSGSGLGTRLASTARVWKKSGLQKFTDVLVRFSLVSFPGRLGGGTRPENEPVPNLTGRALEVNLLHGLGAP